MVRPKSGTKEGEAASEKWRQTMWKKYGVDGAHRKMQEIGAKGGRNGHDGGFKSNPALAVVAGAKGGSISRRKSKYADIFEANRERIIDVIYGKPTLKGLADELEVPYPALMNYVTKYIKNKE